MVSKRKKNDPVGTTLTDRTEELKRAFISTDQNDREERHTFLEETKSLGIMSPSGGWLVQNAAEGGIARAPAQQGKSNESLDGEGCLCPECTCKVHGMPYDEVHDGLQVTWQKTKNGESDTEANFASNSTVSQPQDAFTP